jgi:hypothetical protein
LAEIARGDAAGRPIEVWFADEARIGQKNKITRRWARRGTRPSAPRDQRTRSAYIFGAICPRQGKGAALVLPRCNSAAMTLHLAEIARAVAPGAHAVLMLDQAGWHRSDKLVVPANITLLPLPPRCPCIGRSNFMPPGRRKCVPPGRSLVHPGPERVPLKFYIIQVIRTF